MNGAPAAQGSGEFSQLLLGVCAGALLAMAAATLRAARPAARWSGFAFFLCSALFAIRLWNDQVRAIPVGSCDPDWHHRDDIPRLVLAGALVLLDPREAMFGTEAAPAALRLTAGFPDPSGSWKARRLSWRWQQPTCHMYYI